MQVPTSLSHYGINSYAHQSIDKTTRTAYVAENNGVQLATEDSAEISEEAHHLQDDKMIWLNITSYHAPSQ